MNHAIRREPAFRCDDDRYRFLDHVQAATEACGTTVASLCLMWNHFHLLVHSAEGTLAETMHRVSSGFTRQYNKVHGYTGPLFRSRYTSVPVNDDEQLLVTSRYIHRNPLELGLRIDTYPWSNYRDFLEHGRAPNDSARLILELVGGPQAYRRFVESPFPSDEFDISDGRNEVRAAPRATPSLATFGRAIRTAMTNEGAPDDQGTRAALLILLAVDGEGWTHRQVAAALGLRSEAASRARSKRARQRLVRDERFARLFSAAASDLRDSIAAWPMRSRHRCQAP